MSVMRVNEGVEGRQLAEFTLLLQDFEIYITGAAIVAIPVHGDLVSGPAVSIRWVCSAVSERASSRSSRSIARDLNGIDSYEIAHSLIMRC